MKSNVKNPIRRTFIITTATLFIALCVGVVSLSYLFFSTHLKTHYQEELEEIVTYIDDHVDADDLKECIQNGTSSPKRDELQAFLNGMIDDFKVMYLYIVIPEPERGVLVNVVSATSEEEFAAGETDMDILEATDAYTKEELTRYRSYWDKDGINYFEETSDFGAYYTAVKPIRATSGETVALICADIAIDELHGTTLNMTLFSITSIAVAIFVFGVVLLVLLNHTITVPLYAIEKSTREFAEASHGIKDISELNYDAPMINSGNEVEALSVAIEDMAKELIANIGKTVSAEKQALELEEQNIRLAKEAANVERISRLSKTVTTLLDNMPAMTFYKDVETGLYMACNQIFADFCKCPAPRDVIGKSDYDLFPKETAEHFIEEDKKAMAMDKPHIFFEDVESPDGGRTQFQTTKFKFTDPDGRTMLLGMCVNVTETIRIKRETELAKEAYEEAKHASITYSRIAGALSLDYVNLFYVNIRTDDFIEYSSYTRQDNLALERRGKDFFELSRHDALELLHKDDRQVFVATFTKKNVLEKIDKFGVFTVQYRLLINGSYKYVNMKGTRLIGDDDHIIFGVSNVDEQVKDQEALERIQEERITYSRITALAGDYICIYTVDPNTEDYTEYSAKSEYEGLGLAKSGVKFFESSRKDSVRALYFEDVDMFVSAMTKENVLRGIKENGLFVMDYRLMIKGTPTYVSLRAAMIEEKDGPQLIIGVSNIDAQIKREQAYEQSLSYARRQADIDALTGVKNKHAYIDIEAQLNHSIDEKQPVSFAIVICDINELKQFNDTYGHIAGDEYIKSACHIICEVFKHSPVFRVGGDEFAVIAQGNDYEHIEALMAELDEINRENKESGQVIVAAGMARFEGDRSVSAVFERADAVMYQNKRALKT